MARLSTADLFDRLDGRIAPAGTDARPVTLTARLGDGGTIDVAGRVTTVAGRAGEARTCVAVRPRA